MRMVRINRLHSVVFDLLKFGVPLEDVQRLVRVIEHDFVQTALATHARQFDQEEHEQGQRHACADGGDQRARRQAHGVNHRCKIRQFVFLTICKSTPFETTPNSALGL